MSRVETRLGAFGVLATLFGVGLLFAPDLVGTGPVAGVARTLLSVGSNALLLVLGVVTGLLVFVAAWPRSYGSAAGSTRQFDETGKRSTTPDGGQDLLGADVEAAVGAGGPQWRQLRSMLARTAADTYARQTGVSQSRARTAVKRGQWTADDLAAGVLAGEVGRGAGLRMLLTPERERRRRVERTVTAIERLQQQ